MASITEAVHIRGPISIIAAMRAKPGKADELIALAKKVQESAGSEKEPGTRAWELMRWGDDFVFTEFYDDGAAAHAHTTTEAFQALHNARDDLLEPGSLTLKMYEGL